MHCYLNSQLGDLDLHGRESQGRACIAAGEPAAQAHALIRGCPDHEATEWWQGE